MKEELKNLPRDFSEKMKGLLGEEYEKFLDGYLGHNAQGLRFNILKPGFEAEMENDYLNRLGIMTEDNRKEKLSYRIPWEFHGYYYEESETVRPGKHPYHEMGLYYIQEPSAMSAAGLLNPQPGERILDLCAAPGGKSTQLAAALGGQGLLISNEIHPERSRILSQNIERMGIANAIVTNEDGRALAEHFPLYFHRILVDAPCSGEGMFRKNPLAAGEWSLDHVQMCAARQREVLDYASQMLMPGGSLVYSTCTFSPEENEQVILDFLLNHSDFFIKEITAPWFSPGRPDWVKETIEESDFGQNDIKQELAHTYRLWPHLLRGEGHFAAVLGREAETGSENNKIYDPMTGKKRKGKIRKKDGPDKMQISLFREFAEAVLKKETEDRLLSGKLVLFGDELYRLPKDCPDLNGIKVLRAGLDLGAFRKNRFEPSHALALFLGKRDVKNSLDLSMEDSRTDSYFRGEAIGADTKKGWCLVCVDGFSAGWGKASGGVVKNHYPKGLRK